MAFTFALAGQAFIFLLDQKNEAKKIKAVKPRLQVDCKAFTARIAAASLSQSACLLPVRLFLHMLFRQLADSRFFKADCPPNRDFVRENYHFAPNDRSVRFQHLPTVSRQCRLILPRLAVGCTTVVAAGYSGEFFAYFFAEKK
ncbi:MAG: hypothetical protein EAS52_09405 [Parapedobacter sp.]|nr:MAG: hypothetical protein EAS52_09405 [Parapedobacter sp.]